MKWARLEEGVVIELTDIDPIGRYHESLVWVKCPDEVQQNWLFDGEVFSPPADNTAQNNQQLRDNLLSEANHRISVLTDATDPDIMGDDILPEDIELLKAWKAYRVKLTRITDMLNPVWPAKPE